MYARYLLGIAVLCLTGFSSIHMTAIKMTTIHTVSIHGTVIHKIADKRESALSGLADIKVLGTSNLHDWTMEAKNINCSATFNFPAGNIILPQSLTELNLSVPVQDLKSGKSSMDSRAYTALKAKQFNNIIFSLTVATIVPGQKNQFLVKTTGNLTIAGVTKPITVEVTCISNPDGTLTCTGSERLKMTDYQIKPPVYMLGALKTGDNLTINFIVQIKK